MSDIRTYRVDGMSCEGCVRAITTAIRKNEPDAYVHVDLASGSVAVGSAGSDDIIRQAVEQAGFEFRGKVDAG